LFSSSHDDVEIDANKRRTLPELDVVSGQLAGQLVLVTFHPRRTCKNPIVVIWMIISSLVVVADRAR